MKKFFLILSLSIISTVAFSQQGQAPLKPGGKQINFGLGLNSTGFPFYGKMEFAVHPNITVGPFVALTIGNSHNFSTIAGFGDYHFNRLLNIPSNWDLYAGANLGFRIYLNHDTHTGPLVFGLQLGGRYYWNSYWGVNLEISSGAGYGSRIGISRKL